MRTLDKIGNAILGFIALTVLSVVELFSEARQERKERLEATQEHYGLRPADSDWFEMKVGEKLQYMKDWFATRMLFAIGGWLALSVQWMRTNSGLWSAVSFICLALTFALICGITYREVNTCQKYVFLDGQSVREDGQQGCQEFANAWTRSTGFQLFMLGLTLAMNLAVASVS